MNILEERIKSVIETNSYKAFELNDFLADNPELSSQEFKACEKICKLLEENGIEVERNFTGLPTAFRGTIKSDYDSDIRIGILTEYDALEGIGHGCGHCVNASISVLAALALSEIKDTLSGNIDIIGTPDEEISGKKIYMAERGIFDNYNFVIMLHANTNNVVKGDAIAVQEFRFEFLGKSSHAGISPWEGKNAMNGMILMINAIDMLRQHVKPDTRINGKIINGGESINTVPEKASVAYEIRSFDKFYLQEVIKMIQDCANGAALATQTSCVIKETSPLFDNMKQNPAGTEILEEIYADLNIPTIKMEERIGAASDVGNVSFRCPAFEPSIAITSKPLSLHTHEFANAVKDKEAKDAIVKGSKVIATMIIRALSDTTVLETIRNDFEK